MKNLFKSFAALTILASSLASCGLGGVSGTFLFTECVGSYYTKGTQTVSISRSADSEDHPYFESGITKDCVSIASDSGLAGKTVDAVKFVSTSTIEVTLSGSVTKASTSGEEYDYVQLHIGNAGLVGDNEVNALVRLFNHGPRISTYGTTGGHSANEGQMYYHGTTTLRLPYGTFNADNCTTANITLDAYPEYDGLLIEAVDDMITLSIPTLAAAGEYGLAVDSTTDYPYATIGASCTSFNTSFRVQLGRVLTSYDIYTD